MSMGRLATLVATLPSWVVTMVNRDEMDMNPTGTANYLPPELSGNRALLEALDSGVAAAQAALKGTTDEHLMKPWRFLVTGHVVSEQPRYIMLRDAVFNHLAHHRGQLTVYLRLNDALVPSIYGPSADEGVF
jgi:uncharacterized damage-inducible protein DinB